MNNRNVISCCVAVLTCLSLPLATRAGIIPSPADSITEFHVEGGLTYASGLKNVADQLKTNFGVDNSFTWPIGFKLSAYAKTPSGFAFGGGFGPAEFIDVKDHTHYYHNYDDNQWSYIIPVFADVRYYLPKNGALAPYVRVGACYPISGGDQIGSGTPGPIAAIGAHVWEHRILAVGVEAGYDASQVEVKGGFLHQAEKVRPTEFTLSVFAVF
jgi:hypothetical protein